MDLLRVSAGSDQLHRASGQEAQPNSSLTMGGVKEAQLNSANETGHDDRLAGPQYWSGTPGRRARAISAPTAPSLANVTEQKSRVVTVWRTKPRSLSDACLLEKQSLLSSHQSSFDTLSGLDDEKVADHGYCSSKEEKETIITSKETLDLLARMHELPAQKGTKTARSFWNFFSMYKRIFVLVLLANIITAIVVSCTSGLDQASTATASALNLSAAIAFRNEHVINTLFRFACFLRPSAPFFLRKIAAKVYSYGGFHSGCAIAGSIWYLGFCFLLALNYGGQLKQALVGLAIAVSVLLWLIIWHAAPFFRVAHHNTFELTHRFAGWTAIAVLWAQLAVSVLDQSHNSDTPYAIVMLQTPLFWCLSIISLAIIYPWSRLRWRPVRVEVLSSRAALLHFDYRRLDPCLGVRITDSPLTETHSFATITSPGDEAGFRVLMSRAGDWTSNFIDNPPSHIWVKGAPIFGVMRVALMFKKVLVVATGTGIGPCLSLLESCPDHPVHVLWMGSEARASFGNSIVNAVYTADPGACIVDTTKAGRGDILALAYSRFVESKAEAVVIISNARVTGMVVGGLETRGIPVYGAIFDS